MKWLKLTLVQCLFYYNTSTRSLYTLLQNQILFTHNNFCKGRGRGRDGPDFYPREDFGPPLMDDGFGPPMSDEFGDFGAPMRNDFGPPIRGDDFGHRGMRMRGRGFYNRGGPRGRGGKILILYPCVLYFIL